MLSWTDQEVGTMIMSSKGLSEPDAPGDKRYLERERRKVKAAID